MTDILIIPGDDPAQVARDLLSLADDPAQVRTNTDDGLAFLVPAALGAEYAELLAAVSAEPTPDAAPRRRGGRTRKDTA